LENWNDGILGLAEGDLLYKRWHSALHTHPSIFPPFQYSILPILYAKTLWGEIKAKPSMPGFFT
jgi:hypothetical protein